MPTDTTTGGPKGKMIKIAVVAVCLLGAGVLFFIQKGSASVQPDTPESATAYVCPNDGEVLKITPARFEEMRSTGDVGAREGMPMRTPGLYVRCPQCKKRIMVPGVACPKDGTVFPPEAADGKKNPCPKCGWMVIEWYQMRPEDWFAPDDEYYQPEYELSRFIAVNTPREMRGTNCAACHAGAVQA